MVKFLAFCLIWGELREILVDMCHGLTLYLEMIFQKQY